MSVRKKYHEVLADKLNIVINSEASTEGCWSVLGTFVLAAAEEVVRYGERLETD